MYITELKDDSETGEIQQKCCKTHSLSRTIHTPNKPAELLNEPAYFFLSLEVLHNPQLFVFLRNIADPFFGFYLPFCRRTDKQDYILSSEQLNPVPAPLGLDLVVKKENVKGRGTRRKHSIVLEERTKLLKAAAHEQRPSGDVIPKKETNLDACCLRAPSKSIAKKTCQCLEDVDCEHMNFQVCTRVHNRSLSMCS